MFVIENGVLQEYRSDNSASIIIPEGVKKIAEGVFAGNKTLKRVIFSEGIEEIGSGAFYHCTAIVDIVLPSTLSVIQEDAFAHCYSLKKIELPDTLSFIGNNAFRACHHLELLAIPSQCDFGTGIIDDCWSLRSITLPSNLPYVDAYLFSECSALESINIEATDDSQYVSENGVLYTADRQCLVRMPSGLAHGDVVIQEGVTYIGDGAFAGCDELVSLHLPSSIEEIGQDAFKDCSSLAKFDVDGGFLTTINGMLLRGHKLLACPPNWKSYDNILTVPDFVDELAPYAFANCCNIRKIILPAHLMSIPQGVCARCSSLTDIEIPVQCEVIPKCAFLGCKSLMNIAIPSGITRIEDSAFEGCTSLCNVDMPDDLIHIGSFAFADCNSMTLVDLPASLEELGSGAFAYSGLVSAAIPYSVKSMGKCAFACCQDLATVSISPQLTANPDSSWFWECPNIMMA